MTLLTINKISDTEALVIGQYNYPNGDTALNIPPLEQSFIDSGILVERSSIPDPIIPSGQQVSGMFINPQTKVITYKYSPVVSSDAPVKNPSNLEDYKKNKLYEVEQAYEKEAYGAFTSTAFDGKTEETYSCSQTDQVRINGEVTMSMAVKAGFSTEPISWKNVNQPQCVPWAADSMIALGVDLHKFETEKSDYLEALTVYINSLTTIDDVNKVTYGMTIPTTTTA